MVRRRLADLTATRFMLVVTIFVASIALLVALGLFIKSLPILRNQSLGQLLFSSSWHPSRGDFGMAPFIMGTIWVTVIAGLIALPLSILSALYLAEYASNNVRAIAKPALDLLAGIPSVIYGLWGVLFLSLGGISIGFNVLAGAIVLAIMVIPVVTHVSEEVFRTVPRDIKEASLSVGATKWETSKHVVLRSSLPGLAAAAILGFSRAFGETMAVLMVVGNVPKSPTSILDPAYPLTALIANNYGDMMSVPLYDSVLLFAALILLIVIVVFNVLARMTLNRLQRKWA